MKLIEDNAQAHGYLYHGRKTRSLGDAAGHSFYQKDGVLSNAPATPDYGYVTEDAWYWEKQATQDIAESSAAQLRRSAAQLEPSGLAPVMDYGIETAKEQGALDKYRVLDGEIPVAIDGVGMSFWGPCVTKRASIHMMTGISCLHSSRKDPRMIELRITAFYGMEIDALRFMCSAWLVPKRKLYRFKKQRIVKTVAL
jgi:hypothetical protein